MDLSKKIDTYHGTQEEYRRRMELGMKQKAKIQAIKNEEQQILQREFFNSDALSKRKSSNYRVLLQTMRNDNFMKKQVIDVQLQNDLDHWRLRNSEHTPPITPRDQSQQFEKKFKLDLCARIAIKADQFIGAKDQFNPKFLQQRIEIIK